MAFTKALSDIRKDLLTGAWTFASCRLFTPYRSKVDVATDIFVPVIAPIALGIMACAAFGMAALNSITPCFGGGSDAYKDCGINLALTLVLGVMAALSPLVALASLLVRPFVSMGFKALGREVEAMDDWERVRPL